jgi:hypothetical protein
MKFAREKTALIHRPNTTYAVVVSSSGAEFIELCTVSTDVKKIKELIK